MTWTSTSSTLPNGDLVESDEARLAMLLADIDEEEHCSGAPVAESGDGSGSDFAKKFASDNPFTVGIAQVEFLEERAKIGAVEDNPHAREAWVSGEGTTDSKSKD